MQCFKKSQLMQKHLRKGGGEVKQIKSTNQTIKSWMA